MKKIEVRNIKKSFKNGFVLNGVSFEVTSGEIFSYIGPNGSGKTTTIRIILGTYEKEEGEVKFLENGSEKKLKIGFVLEDEVPFEGLSPIDYLEFFSECYGLKKRDFKELLHFLKLESYKNILNKNLSKGNKKKLCLAKALLHNPDILILDEPFEGIEPETRYEIRDYLLNLKKEGKIIIITSHNLYEIETFTDTVGLIYNGNFFGKWNIQEIKQNWDTLERFYMEKIRGK